MFRLTKTCSCPRRRAGRPCTASLIGLCLEDGGLTRPPAGIPLQRLTLHLHSTGGTWYRASYVSSQTSKASASPCALPPPSSCYPATLRPGLGPLNVLEVADLRNRRPQALAQCLQCPWAKVALLMSPPVLSKPPPRS